MFSSKCYIRKNSPELLDKLRALGYYVCICATYYEDSVWLYISNTDYERGVVHGIGFGSRPMKNILSEFESNTSAIDCGDNEDIFLELAAIEDDDVDHSIQCAVLKKYGYDKK